MASQLYIVVIYVGTYTDKGVPSDGIYSYKLQFNDDELSSFNVTHIESTKVLSPSFLAVSHNKHLLLAVSEGAHPNESQIHSYEILADSYKLKHVSSLPAGGTFSCYVSTDTADKFAYVANYFGGVASAFSLDGVGGQLTPKTQISLSECKQKPPRQEAPHVHMIRQSLDGRFVYVTDLGADVIYKMPHSAQQGFDKTIVTKIKALDGSGPRHFVFHPNGRFLYLSCELTNTVSVFSVDQNSGDLEHIQSISTLPDDFKKENILAEIRLSHDGRTLYVSNRGHDSLALFDTGADGSRLTSKGHVSSGGGMPRNFDLNDRVLIVANQQDNRLNVFKILADGGLQPVGQPIPCPQPVRVAIY